MLVVAAACRALGNQPYKKAQSALLKLMRNPKYYLHEKVSVAAIEARSTVGSETKKSTQSPST